MLYNIVDAIPHNKCTVLGEGLSFNNTRQGIDMLNHRPVLPRSMLSMSINHYCRASFKIGKKIGQPACTNHFNRLNSRMKCRRWC